MNKGINLLNATIRIQSTSRASSNHYTTLPKQETKNPFKFFSQFLVSIKSS